MTDCQLSIIGDYSLMINTKKILSSSRCAFFVLTLLALSGCGQKGTLYLADTDQGLVTSSEVLESSGRPQDEAFAGLDDEEYERTRYLEQQQILPEPSNDPNDY